MRPLKKIIGEVLKFSSRQYSKMWKRQDGDSKRHAPDQMENFFVSTGHTFGFDEER